MAYAAYRSKDRPYLVAYAKSARAVCRGCSKAIAKGVLRLAKMVQSPHFDGMQPNWYHVHCFFAMNRPETIGDICDFDNIRWEDQKLIEEKIAGKNGASKVSVASAAVASATVATPSSSGISRKRSKTPAAPTATISATFRADIALGNNLQCAGCFDTIIRSQVCISKKDFKSKGGTGGSESWYHLDCFAQLRFDLKFFGDGTNIPGVSTFSKEDQQIVKEVLPWIKDDYEPPVAKKLKYANSEEEHLKVQQKKMFEIRDQLSKLQKEDLIQMLQENNQYKPRAPSQILDALADAVLFGALKPCPKCRGRFIYESGTGYKCNRMISDWARCSYITQDPKREAFFISESVKTKCPFFANFKPQVQRRLVKVTEPSPRKEEMKSYEIFQKVDCSKLKQRVKGGGAVDPDSGLEDKAHVYECGKDKYTATLGITDIQTNRNSYYKLQILKDDKEEKYWLFYSWGRIGTTSGGYRCEEMTLSECINKFKSLYLEKTFNSWSDRDNFVKRPYKFYPIEIDHVDGNGVIDLLNSSTESQLDKPVQDLMRLIFDKESMKKTMLEYEIDMDKMPLGKISKNQIQQAYSLLSELLMLVKCRTKDKTGLIEASNKFYTLIPHHFGADGPKVIDTEREIQKKSEMLLSLLDMEISYNLLPGEAGPNQSPLDALYERLNTNIDVLGRDSEEYKLILQYVKNTHSDVHNQYELAVEEVFAIKRNGEDSRYKKFEKLTNRKLLWHGSRATNFAAILSQGLRIAPPEAPSSGYMFGKGIYFADMVSKSANYCYPDPKNSTGLLLLCDVALGNMYERYHAEYIEKLPRGYQSTWGRGTMQPDPDQSIILKNGVEVPCGPRVTVETEQRLHLHHNEFIVYDVAQVKIEYLVKVNFKTKTFKPSQVQNLTNVFNLPMVVQRAMLSNIQSSNQPILVPRIVTVPSVPTLNVLPIRNRPVTKAATRVRAKKVSKKVIRAQTVTTTPAAKPKTVATIVLD